MPTASGWVYPDRLGSIGKFYPYGQERPSATTNGTEKFTGYFRDAETGNDYADQRYELPGQGRFLTPDPWRGGAKARDPASWNRYTYVRGDPINRMDSSGLQDDEGGPSGPPLIWCIYEYMTSTDCNFLLSGLSENPQPTVPSPATNELEGLTLSEYTQFLAAASIAVGALADPQCAAIFNTSGTGTYSPAAVLLSMVYATEGLSGGFGFYVGAFGFGGVPAGDAAVTNPVNASYYNGTYTVANINISNAQGAFFGADIVSQVDTILHELGHVFDFVGPLGGSAIVNEVNSTTGAVDPTLEQQNTLAPCRAAAVVLSDQ